MRWQKQGLIFAPSGQAPWIGTHAALPVGIDLADRQRVFFSSRNRDNQAQIGFVDLSLDDPLRVLDVSPAPVLEPGPLGAFDDAGVTTSCVVRQGGRLFLFYSGWSLGVSVPFYLAIGVAESDNDGRTFRKLSRGPLLDRNDVDPFLTASPWVLATADQWRMWYVSGTSWTRVGGQPRHHYHLRYASSADGRTWQRDGRVCIDYASPGEHAFGRPCVVQDGDGYRMWYAYRGDRYRIGYAESFDGLTWTRKDDQGVEPSREGWDSEMTAYPWVVRRGNHFQMLYNGNGYGRTGFGFALAT